MHRQFFRRRVFCRNGAPALLTGRQSSILVKSYRWSLVTMTLVVVVLMLGFPSYQAAHEIPADVTVQALVKPDGTRLRVLIRVPLEALQDFNFPKRGPGYLDVRAADAMLHDAVMLWIGNQLEVYEGNVLLTNQRLSAVRASLPSDDSFATYEGALAHVTGPPLSEDIDIFWKQAVVDGLFEYTIQSDQSNFSINPQFARLGLKTITVLRFVLPGGAVRAFEFSGNPGLVRLDPRWHQAVLRFVTLGFEHILDGIDHLLFLVCLVIPFRRVRPLVAIITSFTIAHSVTLIASAFGLAPSALWFPPLVEMLIAISIVYMAFENIVGVKLKRRWLITFGFGLVHGFGFSFALRETLQFAGSHLLTSLLSFNVGVELGQLLVLVLVVPTLGVLFRFVVAERIGTILVSALVAHTSWHWMSERAGQLSQYPIEFRMPSFDFALLAAAMRVGMLALIIAGLIWLMTLIFPTPGSPTGGEAHDN
ncbi:MAG TPA: HupE/UreJ family protein [Nitrospirales bacterium]|nr:HupE/UreJ family protein [Nitrospirales bacterium]